MIDGSEKRNRQWAFQLQNSHVCEKRIRICDRSAQFLVNCFEKIVMATNSSRFNSTYMFACKSHRCSSSSILKWAQQGTVPLLQCTDDPNLRSGDFCCCCFWRVKKKNKKQKNRLIAGYDDPGCLAA